MEQIQVPVSKNDMDEKFRKDKYFDQARKILIKTGILEEFKTKSEEDEYPMKMYRLTDCSDVALERAHEEIVDYFEMKSKEGREYAADVF